MPREAAPRWSKDAGCWYANVGPRDRGGRATEVYFRRPVGDPPVPPPRDARDKGGAWDWLRAFARSSAIRSVDPEAPTVQALGEMYLTWAKERVEAGDLTAVHFRNQRLHLCHFCDVQPPGEARFGGRLARDVKHHHLDAAVRSWGRAGPEGRAPYSANYVKNIVSTVLAVYSWASRPRAGRARERYLDSNPLEGFGRPSVPHSPERFAERSTAAAFLKFYRNHADRQEKFRRIVAPSGSVSLSGRKSVLGRYERVTILLERLLMGTGCRPGEACVLEWGDIRWKAGTTRAGHEFAKAVIPFDRWKAGEKTGRARTIYLSPTLTRALARLHARPGSHPVRVFTHGRGRGGKGAGEPWESGSRLSKVITRVRKAALAAQASARAKRLAGEDDSLTAAERAIEGAGLEAEGPGRIANYLWRHTAASTMLMMGIDMATVAQLLGTSVEMLNRHYKHLLDGHLSDAADRFAAARSRPSSAAARRGGSG